MSKRGKDECGKTLKEKSSKRNFDCSEIKIDSQQTNENRANTKRDFKH